MEDDVDVLAHRLRQALAADPGHPRAQEMRTALADLAEADGIGRREKERGDGIRRPAGWEETS